MKFVLLYLVTGGVFLALDAIVLGTVGGAIFRDVLGDRMRANPNWGAAAGFYLLFVVGVLYFASVPALESGDWTMALVKGALFGFFTYLTFEATAYSVLEGWRLKLVLMDTTWGAVLTGTSATAGVLIARALNWFPASGT